MGEMTKKEMEKFIPKDTPYCRDCRWRKFIGEVKLHRDTNCTLKDECKEVCWTTEQNSCRNLVFRCEYLDFTDYEQKSLLWDGCKECGID